MLAAKRSHRELWIVDYMGESDHTYFPTWLADLGTKNTSAQFATANPWLSSSLTQSQSTSALTGLRLLMICPVSLEVLHLGYRTGP